jgi:hypothetical protein
MTFAMFLLGTSVRTPVFMWIVAMSCDTAIIITYMLTKAAA